MERTNKIYVIGTLIDVRDLREGEKDGSKWIAGSAIVGSGDSEIELKFFSTDKTKEGAQNKRYANYAGLKDKIGGRIKANGELSGRVFYNESSGQVIHFNEVSAGFFNDARPNDADVATFEFGGYVSKPLYERLDKEEKLVAYEMELSQSNYSGTGLNTVRFTVDKNSANIVKAIQGAYTKDRTVLINGEIRYIVSMIERTEEVAFGDPIVKQFQSTLKTFNITGGKEPIITEAAYSAADIARLEAAYKDYIAEVEREAKARSEAGAAAPANAPSSNSGTDRLL